MAEEPEKDIIFEDEIGPGEDMPGEDVISEDFEGGE